jgi:hypothetical protein
MGQFPGLAGDKVIYNFFNNNEEMPVDTLVFQKLITTVKRSSKPDSVNMLYIWFAFDLGHQRRR